MKRSPENHLRSLLAGLLLLPFCGCVADEPNFLLEACGKATAQAAHAAAADALRVMTVNMWGIPVVSQHIDARFDALAERLQTDATIDVVGLQEVWNDSSRVRLLAKLRDEFPYQVDFQGEHGRSGLALISRRPFVGKPRFEGYEETGAWWKPWNGEFIGRKGVGAVKIALAGDHAARSVWVAVTHLHACYEEDAPLACDRTDEFAAYRGAQVKSLRRFVNHLANDEPAIVLGDFNFTPTSDYFAELQRDGDDGPFDRGWQRVHEPHAPPTRIDHIWLRPGRDHGWHALDPAGVTFVEPVHVDRDTQAPLSDHCAIVATLAPTSE